LTQLVALRQQRLGTVVAGWLILTRIKHKNDKAQEALFKFDQFLNRSIASPLPVR
jgi:hypothetical protein